MIGDRSRGFSLIELVVVLAFEKPVVDLVTRIKELRALAGADERLVGELRRLEEKSALLAREVFQNLTAHQNALHGSSGEAELARESLPRGRLFIGFPQGIPDLPVGRRESFRRQRTRHRFHF